MKFGKAMRLSGNKKFRSVIGNRQRWSDGLLTVYRAPNDLDCSRMGVSIGRKAGPAVKRNRLKRLIREAWRQKQNLLPSGMDHVIMVNAARVRTQRVAFGDVETSIAAYRQYLSRKGRDDDR